MSLRGTLAVGLLLASLCQFTSAYTTSSYTSETSATTGSGYWIPACNPFTRPENFTNYHSWAITSPNHPGDYFNNLDCQWMITSTYDVVTIYFSIFQTESCCDYVDIHNGPSVASSLIARLSGSPPTYVYYTTTQRQMLVRFTTDGSVTSQGFYAYFYSDYGTGGSTEYMDLTTSMSTTEGPIDIPLACDARYRPEFIYNTTGWITSPNHPMNYFVNLDCSWLITAAFYDQVVSLRFTYFDVEFDYDYLVIYDGNNAGSRVIANLTGTPSIYNVNYTTTEPSMLITFFSDYTYTRPGFNATYRITQGAWLTTGQWTTSTPVVTTSQPNVPTVEPRPYVAVKLNGTFTATGTITQTCSDSFSTDFRNSFQELISRTGNLIANGQLCADGNGPLRVVAGQIQSLFIGNTGQATFSALVGTNPPDWVSLQTDESCSWQVSDFVRNGNNWRQPIISNIFGCPSITVDSNSFTWQQSLWDVFS